MSEPSETEVGIDNYTVGVWYVSYEQPVDVICTLRRFDDHYRISWAVREYAPSGELHRRHVQENRRPMIPLSAAVEYVRSYVKALRAPFTVNGEWEVLRGGRTMQEFVHLILTMPNCSDKRAPTVEEFAAYEKALNAE